MLFEEADKLTLSENNEWKYKDDSLSRRVGMIVMKIIKEMNYYILFWR
jgi:hypothetical protein